MIVPMRPLLGGCIASVVPGLQSFNSEPDTGQEKHCTEPAEHGGCGRSLILTRM